MADSFRSRLNQIADEHERVLAGNDRLKLENQQLRGQLGLIGGEAVNADEERLESSKRPESSLGESIAECLPWAGVATSESNSLFLGEDQDEFHTLPDKLFVTQAFSPRKAVQHDLTGHDTLEFSLLPEKPRPTSAFDMQAQKRAAAMPEGFDRCRVAPPPGRGNKILCPLDDAALESSDPTRAGEILTVQATRDKGTEALSRPSILSTGKKKSVNLSFAQEEPRNSVVFTSEGMAGNNVVFTSEGIAEESKSFCVDGFGQSHGSEDSFSEHLVNAQTFAVLPRWFNPTREDQQAMAHIYKTNSMMSQTQYHTRSERKIDQADCYVLSPLGKPRLSWDFIAVLLLLMEFWVTPFELIFLSEVVVPKSLRYLSFSVTVFFGVDILLNFNTGFLREDNLVLKRMLIIKEYAKFWLWVDIIATLPFDLILESFGGVFSVARVGKASKAVKLLRYLKMVRAFRLMRTVKQTGALSKHFFLGPLRQMVAPIQAFVFLVLLAHVNGCVWASLQSNAQPTSLGECYRFYYQSFCWAMMAFVSGVFNDGFVDTAPIWTLELMLAFQRLFLLLYVSKRVILIALSHSDEVKQANSVNMMLKFFRKHNVSLSTQLQAMLSLTDTVKVQKQQGEYHRLNELPQQLGPIIRHELWRDHLMTLGLIKEMTNWHLEFTMLISQVVFEKNLPSRSLLFELFGPATAACCILQGEVRAQLSDSWCDEKPLIFKKGMWLGENALVSPLMLYSSTCTTKVITSLMVIPGDDFRQTVSKLGLMNRFESFCSEELWKGMCGRCGSLGNHFSDKCPELFGLQRFAVKMFGPLKQKSTDAHERGASSTFTNFLASPGDQGSSSYKREMSTRSSVSGTSVLASIPSRISTIGAKWGKRASKVVHQVAPGLKSHQENTVHVGRGLRILLEEHELDWLIPILCEMNVTDLDDLECLDIDFLKNHLLQTSYQLTPRQEQILSPRFIGKFRRGNSGSVHQALFRDVSRLHHLAFLSHYKVEAGTEAALLRTELVVAISGDASNVGNNFDEPVFLDSDNLQSLDDLRERIKKTHNVVLLLTKDVLTRPWVLLELVCALREGVRVLLVDVCKPGTEFVFPDAVFFERLRSGRLLNDQTSSQLEQLGTTLLEVEQAIRQIFQQIAIPYSPHKATEIRRAEIETLLKRCRLKNADVMSMKRSSVGSFEG